MSQLPLEALVGHIYVVGGRAIGSAAPGFVVSLPPKRAPRPRQEDTLFTLLVPNGSVKAPATLYDTLAKQVATCYFKSSGGITGGLREALTELNQVVFAQQQDLMQPFRVAIICAVMRERELYVGRCGPTFALFKQGQSFQSFPKERTRENLLLAPPLGASMEAKPELFRFDLAENALVLLADDGFLGIEDSDFEQALGFDAIGDCLEPTRKLVKLPLAHASLLQFISEETPTPPQSEPIPQEAPPPEPPPPPPKEPASSRRSLALKKTVAKTLVNVAETTDKVGERIFAPEEQEASRTGWRAFFSNLLFLLVFIIPLVVIVVVIGLALNPTGQSAFEFCRADVLLLADAARQLTPLEGAVLDDAKAMEARLQWEVVRAEALLCEREKAGDQEMLLIAGEAQNNLDRFDRVTRREVQALRRFGTGADLRGPVSGNWITLYTLDRANDEIYRDNLSSDGRILTQVSESPIIFKGQSIGANVVSDLVDIKWLIRGGLPGGATNVPIALDQTGLLIWRSESFGENEAYRLITPATWNKPIAMATWQLNLYVLDPPAQQIWRYVPNRGVYSEIPEEYFFGLGDVRPDLSNAIDLGIDEDGNLFMLFADGRVKKFRGGEEQAFALYNLPLGALKSGASLFVDNNPISRGLLVTDRNNQTLYTMSLGGTVNLGYRPLNQFSAFENLSGALVNTETNSIYILAGEFLYHMPRQ